MIIDRNSLLLYTSEVMMERACKEGCKRQIIFGTHGFNIVSPSI